MENRYKAHKQCVNDLLGILQHHNVNFSLINRAELDRQHLANIDLLVAVGGDGTALSAAHFLDHGTIPLLAINSDPIKDEDKDTKKKTDERRSHGALCMFTANTMSDGMAKVLYGGGSLKERTRINCLVKSTFSETKLVPALNDILVAHPSPAAVSRFRMGWAKKLDYNSPLEGMSGSSFEERSTDAYSQYGTITRFGGEAYDSMRGLNVWSSGMWISTATGSTAAMAAAGGMPMSKDSTDLQYLIREHIFEGGEVKTGVDNGFIQKGDKIHLRWNSQKGKIFIDGSHLTQKLELGDEILISSDAPPLRIYVSDSD